MRTFCVVWGTLWIWSRRITQPRAKEKDGHHCSGPGEGRQWPDPTSSPHSQGRARAPGGLWTLLCGPHAWRPLLPPASLLLPPPQPHWPPRCFPSTPYFSLESPPPAVFPVKTQCLHSLLLRSSRSLCPNAPHQRSPTQPPPEIAPSCHSQAHYPSSVSAVRNTKTHLLIYHLVFPY